LAGAFLLSKFNVCVCAKGRNQKILSKMGVKQALYGWLFEGCSTLSENGKRNALTGYLL